MKMTRWLIVVGITLLSIAIYFAVHRVEQQGIRIDTEPSALLERSEKKQHRENPSPAINSHDLTNDNPLSSITAYSKQECVDMIHELSVTYDASELPKINAFLAHEDPEVRHAAVQGMIVLGDSKAAHFLREAAKKAESAKEAVSLEEAAEYMELPPSANFKLRKIPNRSK